MKDSHEDQPVIEGRWKIVASIAAFLILVVILYNILEYVWW
jgi:hypothetical protein